MTLYGNFYPFLDSDYTWKYTYYFQHLIHYLLTETNSLSYDNIIP